MNSTMTVTIDEIAEAMPELLDTIVGTMIDPRRREPRVIQVRLRDVVSGFGDAEPDWYELLTRYFESKSGATSGDVVLDELEVLRAALRKACNDSFADGESAMRSYLEEAARARRDD